MPTFLIKDSLIAGWEGFKRNPWPFVGATAFMMIITGVGESIGNSTDGVAEALVELAFTVLGWWFTLGFLRMALLTESGGNADFKMLFGESGETLWRYALATILSVIIIVIGFALLIVPGIIATLALLFVGLLVLEKKMNPIEALKESRRLTTGSRWQLLGFVIVMVIFNGLGALLLLVGLLVTIPVSAIAFAHVYRALDRRDDIEPVAPLEMPAASA